MNLFQLTGNADELQHHFVGMLLNQIPAKGGVKKHGDRARHVLMNELLQLHDMDVFTVVMTEDLHMNRGNRL